MLSINGFDIKNNKIRVTGGIHRKTGAWHQFTHESHPCNIKIIRQGGAYATIVYNGNRKVWINVTGQVITILKSDW